LRARHLAAAAACLALASACRTAPRAKAALPPPAPAAGAAASQGGSAMEAPSMTPEQVHDRLAAGQALLIVDVRGKEAYQAARLPGSVNVPLSELEARKGEIPTDKPVVVYCGGGGCPMSRHAAAELVGWGYRNVYDLEGGILDWQQKGFATESGPAAGAR
jgi:rhodanese-related sulfurtransferase